MSAKKWTDLLEFLLGFKKLYDVKIYTLIQIHPAHGGLEVSQNKLQWWKSYFSSPQVGLRIYSGCEHRFYPTLCSRENASNQEQKNC